MFTETVFPFESTSVRGESSEAGIVTVKSFPSVEKKTVPAGLIDELKIKLLSLSKLFPPIVACCKESKNRPDDGPRVLPGGRLSAIPHQSKQSVPAMPSISVFGLVNENPTFSPDPSLGK